MFLKTQYGLRNIDRLLPYPQHKNNSLEKLLEDSGAVMALMPEYAKGYRGVDTSGGVNALNSPFTNPLIDYTQNGNNATLQNFAGTSTSGYALKLIENDNGFDTNIVNLLGNNGNMIDSNADNRADGWIYPNITPISCIANEVVFIPTAIYAGFAQEQIVRNQNLEDKLYFCSNVKSDTTTTYLQLYQGTGGAYLTKRHSGSGQHEFLSATGALKSKTNASINITTDKTSAWTNVSVKQAHLLNLTSIFGEGNEPSQTDMDFVVQNAIARYGYISTKTLRLSYRTFLSTDGIDDVGILANNPSVDITGAEDFEIAVGFVTPSLLSISTIYYDGGDGNSVPDRKLQIFYDSVGGLSYVIGGVFIGTTVDFIKTNTLYDVRLKRIAGIASLIVNGVEVAQIPNTTLLLSKPYKRLFARTNSGTGTTHALYFKGLMAWCIIARGSKISEVDRPLDRIARDYRIGV